MYAKLHTAPQEIDKNIAYLARVSSTNPDNPNFTGLIKYLIREGHWSPFDMVNVVIEIETEKDIAIQLLRHKGFYVQEWSQRYADCSDMESSTRECRMQDTKNRQNSLKCEDSYIASWWEAQQNCIKKFCFDTYKKALEVGIAKEVARSVLPIGLTKTKLFVNASIRTWLFYVLSRTHESSQKEHRDLANEVKNILIQIAPCTCEAFFDVLGDSE